MTPVRMTSWTQDEALGLSVRRQKISLGTYWDLGQGSKAVQVMAFYCFEIFCKAGYIYLYIRLASEIKSMGCLHEAEKLSIALKGNNLEIS